MRTWAAILQKRARLAAREGQAPRERKRHRYRVEHRLDNGALQKVPTCPLCAKGRGGRHDIHHRLRERGK